MALHESGENYLEQILILSKLKNKVRAVDICAALGFSRPTVSVMLRELRRDGFIESSNGALSLTPAGLVEAERIYERHCIISEVLMRLGVPHDAAVDDACKIEHDLSAETFSRIKEFYEKCKAQESAQNQ